MVNTYRILLVDDEEEVRTSIIQKIDWVKTGFTVVGDAENGEDALEKIEQMEPDVVLTDIRIPYMDGLQLAERLRRDKPSVKVVIFSGFDDFEYAKKAIDGICDKYLKTKEGEMSLGGICLVAGLGGKDRRPGTYDYYMSEPIVEDDAKGVGPFLLAYTELLRYQNK